MTLDQNTADLALRLSTEFKTVKGTIGLLSNLSTTAKGNVVAAINELEQELAAIAAGGSATNLDALTDVTLTAPADQHILLRNAAGQFVNVLGSTVFQVANANLTSLAGVANTAYGRSLLTLASQTAFEGLIPTGTTAVAGKLLLASTAEATTGTDTAKATTAAGVTARVNTLVPSASDTVQGKVELATTVEATTGTDTTRAITAAGLKAATDALRTEIFGPDVPALLNSLDELAAALGDDPNFAATLQTQLGNRVRYDAAQVLTAAQQLQARQNIGAASAADVGSTTTDYVGIFNTGLAS